MRKVHLDGVTWERVPGGRCAHCNVRTYRVSRRADNELIVRPLPGPHGQHTLRSTRTQRLFTICTRCLDQLGGAAGAIAWEANRPTY